MGDVARSARFGPPRPRLAPGGKATLRSLPPRTSSAGPLVPGAPGSLRAGKATLRSLRRALVRPGVPAPGSAPKAGGNTRLKPVRDILRPCLRACVEVVARLFAFACHEGPLLGRSRVASRARGQDRALWRQHLMRRGPLGGGDACRRRRRDRDPQARQGAGRRRRGRPRARPPADQPHALGPHPGAAVLRAALPARQQDVRLRAQARRPAPAGRVRLADARSVFPGSVRGGGRRDRVQGADRRGEVLDRRREGRVRAAQPPVHRDGVPADRGRRVGGLRVGHRAVLRHPVRGRVHRAAAVAGRRAAREGQAEAREDARGRRTAVRGRGPGHLRHDVHARGLPAHPALRPFASRRRGRGRAARRARRAWRCFTTRPSAPTPRSTRSSPTRAPPAAKASRKLDIVAAYEGLDVELGQR